MSTPTSNTQVTFAQIGRTQRVGKAVDIWGRHVDVACGSSAVHRATTVATTFTHRSSTTRSGALPSRCRAEMMSSTPSTAAKTMDEDINFLGVHSQSIQNVDSVDSPLAERAPRSATMTGAANSAPRMLQGDVT